MKILCLETASDAPFLLYEGRRMLLEPGPLLSQTLALCVQEILEGGVPDLLAVGIGPGSFTGVRAGASLAQALAFGWKIPLVPFCSLHAFAPEKDGPFTLVADARSGGVYAVDGERTGKSVRFSPPRKTAFKELASPLFSPTPERFPAGVAPAPLAEENLLELLEAAAPKSSWPPHTPLPFFYLDSLASKPFPEVDLRST